MIIPQPRAGSKVHCRAIPQAGRLARSKSQRVPYGRPGPFLVARAARFEKIDLKAAASAEVTAAVCQLTGSNCLLRRSRPQGARATLSREAHEIRRRMAARRRVVLIRAVQPFGKRPTVSLSLLANLWGPDSPLFLRNSTWDATGELPPQPDERPRSFPPPHNT